MPPKIVSVCRLVDLC